MPDGFRIVSGNGAAVVARAENVSAVSALLEGHDTLFDAVLQMPRVMELRGRGITPVVDIRGVRCVVRHFRRGGSVATALGDRYSRFAENRVVRELNASETMRARGVATPAVEFGAWYTRGLFRRFDIATRYIANARDLAEVLFDEAQRDAAVTRAVHLLRDVVTKGLLHHDLNLKNILVDADRAYVLDLDRAEIRSRLSASEAQSMRSRFFRSLDKWEGKLGRKIPPRLRTQLGEAFVV